ncbi:hypothetical protein Mapa_006652 [Marchantia paleacea]|nr:hypothetical protein Mapa_006652 [Marchantia paleacea]
MTMVRNKGIENLSSEQNSPDCEGRWRESEVRGFHPSYRRQSSEVSLSSVPRIHHLPPKP